MECTKMTNTAMKGPKEMELLSKTGKKLPKVSKKTTSDDDDDVLERATLYGHIQRAMEAIVSFHTTPRPLLVISHGFYQLLVVWSFYVALLIIHICSIFVLPPQRWYVLGRNRIVVLYRQHLDRVVRRICKMTSHRLQYYHEEPTDATCHICDEEPLITQLASMNTVDCDHMFCFNCIQQWSQQQQESSCPLCRKTFGVISSCATSRDIVRERERFTLVPISCLEWLEPRAILLGISFPISLLFYVRGWSAAFTIISMTSVLTLLDHDEARRAMVMTILPSLLMFPDWISPLTSLLPSFVMAMTYNQSPAIVGLFLWLMWYGSLNLMASIPWYISVTVLLLFWYCPGQVANVVDALLQCYHYIRGKIQRMLLSKSWIVVCCPNLAVLAVAIVFSFASPYMAEVLINRSRI